MGVKNEGGGVEKEFLLTPPTDLNLTKYRHVYMEGITVIIAFLLGYYLGVYRPTLLETLQHIKGLQRKSLELVIKPKTQVFSPTKKFHEELFNKQIDQDESGRPE